MSEENEGEENQDDTLEEEFEFYFSFTKPLVLDLPTEEDRAIAAAWVQKLEAEPMTRKERGERLNYLKLLLFVLQRGRLSGIFARQPPSGPLQPFPQGFSVLDMGNLMLEQDDDQLYGGGDAGRVPYVMEISNDLREYVASQEIPNFGVQMYYAWSSDEPVNKWSLFDEEKFPHYILEKIKQMKATRYDEKTQSPIDICEPDKKGCNFPFPHATSTKKVRSPEEIEKSQGRSFLTYMGLVGRIGNFNDKCDEDPERGQRQNPPRKCSAKRKKCPGAADDGGDEDFDSFVSGLGGEINSINRPCLCPNPAHQSGCPIQKKRPQSSCQESTPVCRDSDGENNQWSVSASKPGGASRMREQCFDSGPPAMSSLRNGCSRNVSMNRRPMECPTEGNQGGFPNQSGGLCVCTSPPCSCPCPRGPPKPPVQKTPPAAGGRVCQSPSRTCARPRQDAMDFNRNRGIGTHLTTFTAPDPGPPTPYRPDMTPTGGRSGGPASDSLRPVMHCYDRQNPDPALTKTIEKNDNWLPLEGGGVKYVDTEFKIAANRDQLIAKAMQNKCNLNARRGLFNNAPQPGPSGMNRMRPQNDYQSPPLLTHPLCDYSGSNEDEPYPAQQCPQNYQDYQGGGGQGYPACGRINTNTQKKPTVQPQPQAQPPCRAKSAGPSTFAVTNDSGRLANINKVLRGMKQKTEAHGDKCEPAGPPVKHSPDEGYCPAGGQPQAQSRTCQRQNRAAAVFASRNEQMMRNLMGGCGGYQAPPPTSAQPGCSNYSSPGFGTVPNPPPGRYPDGIYPSEAYDFSTYKSFEQNEPCYEEEDDDDECDECNSSGSMEDQCQNREEQRDYTLSNPCKEALSRRRQDYYKIAEWEDTQYKSQGTRDNEYCGVSTAPAEFIGTMLSANDTSYQALWANPKRFPAKTPANSPRSFAGNGNERTVASTRTSPGNASRYSSTVDESYEDSLEMINECTMDLGVRNRYMENSLMQGPNNNRSPNQPVCSTPLRHHREPFKDQGCEDISGINP